MDTTTPALPATVDEASDLVRDLRRKLKLSTASETDVRHLLAQVLAFKATLEAELAWRQAQLLRRLQERQEPVV
jgi:type II secretory pathway predicted ATPase ExeA